jgi:hypothetical protein
MMPIMFSKRERGLLAAFVGLLAVAALGPPLGQPVNLNDYADQRVLWGVPFALDVLTNAGFALVAAAGIRSLARYPAAVDAERSLAGLFFIGLVLTAFASGWYHLAPDDTRLAIDRYGMSGAFAGLLGLAAAGRVSGRAGAAFGLGMLVLAPASVLVWSASGNVLPWAVVQFGGMGVVLWLAALRPVAGRLPIRWVLVILVYALAKLLEANDHLIYELTGQTVSGHSLKHLVAALAALPVLAAIRATGYSGRHPESIADGPASRA